MTVRISEYYDIFDVRQAIGNDGKPASQTTVKESKAGDLPNNIKDTEQTNPFRGFWNDNNFAAGNPNNTTTITGKHKAPQGITNIDILENGDIMCYPPNVSVPYWDKIIFRNYDYLVQPSQANSKYLDWADKYTNPYITDYPSYKYDSGTGIYEPSLLSSDKALPNIVKQVRDYSEVPVFLKFDQYQSRSKVIFSSVDKTRNPDIEFKFGYHHGQMEPIKLNLSPSCNNPITNIESGTVYHYNHNFSREELEALLVKCYWSIEWVYDPTHGN